MSRTVRYLGCTLTNVGLSWYLDDRWIGSSLAEAKRAVKAQKDAARA